MRLVKITWVDACGIDPDWEDLTEEVLNTVLIESVGWLIQETPLVTVLTSNITINHKAGNQQCGRIVIPTVCVQKIEGLRK